MNYPNGIKRNSKSFLDSNFINYSNRGMSLENDLNESNKYYLDNDIAVIYKKPTPITINKVDFKSRNDATIKEAHFKIPSTTDYNGIYKGRYIDFEAKETKCKTSFPLNNIHAHQIDHLIKVKNHGAIAFIIVRFSSLNKNYLLFLEDLKTFLDENNRKSIPLEFFKNFGYEIKEGLIPRLDYLKIIDKEILWVLRRNQKKGSILKIKL